MTDQPELFELIRGLTQSEKRYFARFASLHSGRAESDYFRLFQRLVRMRTYDASIVKEEFGKHAEQLKRQLFGKILTALRLYHEQDEAETRVWSMYHNSQLLQNRQIIRSAQRERSRANVILTESGLPALEIHIRERAVSSAVTDASPEILQRMLVEYTERSNQLLSEVKGVSLSTSLLIGIETLNRKFEGTRSESELMLIDRFLGQQELRTISRNASPREKLILNFCNGLGNYLRCDFHLAARHFDSAREVLKQHPHLSQQDPVIRVRIIADRALAHFHAGNISMFRESMAELKVMNEESGTLSDYVGDITLILELMELNRDKKYAEALRKFRSIRGAGYSIQRNDQVSQVEIYFVFQEVTALWGAGELKKASTQLSQFANGRRMFMKDDAYVTGRIVFLLLRFELEDETSTLSELRSVRALLVKKKKYYRVERALLKFVSLMMTKNTIGERKRSTRKFYKELSELKALPFERNAFLYFDFQAWAKNYENRL